MPYASFPLVRFKNLEAQVARRNATQLGRDVGKDEARD